MKKIVALSVALMLLFLPALTFGPTDDPVRAGIESKSGTWGCGVGEHSLWFNASDIHWVTVADHPYTGLAPWTTARNSPDASRWGTGTFGAFDVQSGEFYDPGGMSANLRRTILRWDISDMPTGYNPTGDPSKTLIIKHIYLNATMTGSTNRYIYWNMGGGSNPDPFNPNPHMDYDIDNYNPNSVTPNNTFAKTYYTGGFTQWGSNNTGLSLFANACNGTHYDNSTGHVHEVADETAYVTMMMLSYWDERGNSPPGYYYVNSEGLSANLNMTVIYTGGQSRITPLEPGGYEFSLNTAVIIGLMGVLGLLIMISSPYIVVKHYQHGEEDGPHSAVIFFFMEILGFGLLYASVMIGI